MVLRWYRLRQLMTLAAATYILGLLFFATLLPKSLNELVRPIEHAIQFSHPVVTPVTILTTALKTTSTSVLPTTTAARPLLSTVCPLRLTAKDNTLNVTVEEYFKPLHIVTKVVSVYPIQPHAHFCSGALDILFLVPSRPSRESYRQAIRETWGSGFWPDTGHGIKMAVLFLLGWPPEEETAASNASASVEKEAAIHGDVLLVNAKDGYRQMTIKMLAGLQWLSERCLDVRYVARVDEDHFLNVPILYHNVHTLFQQHIFTQRHHAIVGKILCTTTSVVHRTKLSKHFVDFPDYPFDYFPTYLAGATFVMSSKLVPRLVNVSRYVRIFTVDDAYITGVLVRVLQVLLVNLPKIGMDGSIQAFWNMCGISRHGTDPNKMRAIWKMLYEAPGKCRPQALVFKICKNFCHTRGIKWK